MVCGTSLTLFYPKSCLFASVCGSVENFVEKVETQNDSPLFYGVYNRLAGPPLHKNHSKVQVLFPSRLAEISKAAVPKHGGWGSGLIYAAGFSVFSSAEGSSSVAAGTMISLISV